MKIDKTEELIMKSIDGELSPEEATMFQSILDADSALAAEVAAMKETAESVRAEVPLSEEPPYGDFFNSQLMRKIDLDVRSKAPKKKAESWLRSFRWAWAQAGVLALVLAFFMGHRIAKSSEPTDVASNDTTNAVRSFMPTVYFAEESLEADLIADAEGDVSVIVVNGLSAIRDDFDIMTASTTTSLPDRYNQAETLRFQ